MALQVTSRVKVGLTSHVWVKPRWPCVPVRLSPPGSQE